MRGAMPVRLPERPASIPTTKIHVSPHMLWGPLSTVATLAAIEVLQEAGIDIPNPAALYFLPLVFSALSGGTFAGLLSALITLGYSAFFYSDTGLTLTYT